MNFFISLFLVIGLNASEIPEDQGILKNDERIKDIKLQPGSLILLEQVAKGQRQPAFELKFYCYKLKNDRLKCDAVSLK